MKPEVEHNYGIYTNRQNGVWYASISITGHAESWEFGDTEEEAIFLAFKGLKIGPFADEAKTNQTTGDNNVTDEERHTIQ